MTVGEATSTALGRLNVHPKISHVPSSNSRSLDCSDLTAVVVSIPYLRFDIQEVVGLSDLARSKNLGFFALIDTARVSWMFSDFGAQHIVDAHTPPLKRDDKTAERKAVDRIEEFEFADLRTFTLSQLNNKYWTNKTSFPRDVFLFVHLYMQYRLGLVGDAEPSSSPRAKRLRHSDKIDFETFVRNFKHVHITEELISQLVHLQDCGPVSAPHIAAIHGALATQELIKFITKKDSPLVNTIAMNSIDGGAIVLKQPSSLESRIIHEDKDDEIEEIKAVAAGGGSSIDVLE